MNLENVWLWTDNHDLFPEILMGDVMILPIWCCPLLRQVSIKLLMSMKFEKLKKQ
jgi:hypothetical protein